MSIHVEALGRAPRGVRIDPQGTVDDMMVVVHRELSLAQDRSEYDFTLGSRVVMAKLGGLKDVSLFDAGIYGRGEYIKVALKHKFTARKKLEAQGLPSDPGELRVAFENAVANGDAARVMLIVAADVLPKRQVGLAIQEALAEGGTWRV